MSHSSGEYSSDDDDLFGNPNHGSLDDEGKVVTFISFGHKHGIPGGKVVHFNIQAKVPNPPNSLRKNRTGLDQELQIELFKEPTTVEAYNSLVEEITKCINEEDAEEQTIAIGCFSGKHRSVAFVEKLARHNWESLHKPVRVQVHHRDINGGSANSKKSRARSRDEKTSRNKQ